MTSPSGAVVPNRHVCRSSRRGHGRALHRAGTDRSDRVNPLSRGDRRGPPCVAAHRLESITGHRVRPRASIRSRARPGERSSSRRADAVTADG